MSCRAAAGLVLALAATVVVAEAPRLRCHGLDGVRLGVPALTVLAAAELPASGPAGQTESHPAHCRVAGELRPRTGVDGQRYAVGLELRMPLAGWSGRLYVQGDSGLGGAFPAPLGHLPQGLAGNALSRGDAVLSWDGGHRDRAGGLDGSFGADPQARLDYAWQALADALPVARQVLGTFHGRPPQRTYLAGCSKGGQSGLAAAWRLGDQVDGIVIGNPGLDLPRASLAQLHDVQQLARVDPKIEAAFTPADLALVAGRIRARCDALDGLADDHVADVEACQRVFDLRTDVPRCAAGARPDGRCLSAAQHEALAAIFDGVRARDGRPLYAPFPWDPGLAGRDWWHWKSVLNVQVGAIGMGNLWSVPPVPTIAPFSPQAEAYARGFDVERGEALIQATSPRFKEPSLQTLGAPDPLDLSRLRGKLLVWHGTGDPLFSSQATLDWVRRVQARDPAVAAKLRLFLVPGMNHCGGGPATDRFDAYAALVDWVEHGRAPERLVASATPGNPDLPASWSPQRTRPLCAWPARPRWREGATERESASSFDCVRGALPTGPR